jgi:hypothetical protein
MYLKPWEQRRVSAYASAQLLEASILRYRLDHYLTEVANFPLFYSKYLPSQHEMLTFIPGIPGGPYY